jgi:spore coat polysaccharide biosynthesis protein SpsF
VTALVLQARIDSSRLHGKSLLPLNGKHLIFRVMEALGALPVDAKILACPEDSVSAFSQLAVEAGFLLVAGPKDDVLARYCLAIRRTGADRIIRATGDNPFVFVDAAAAINSEAIEQNADYAAYSDLPYGSGVESISSEALLRAEREAETPAEREHVCPYLYNHPEIFRLHRPTAPPRWRGPEIRLTVDTHDDYERALALYRRLFSLSQEERYLGENIIAAYKSLFAEDAAPGRSE